MDYQDINASTIDRWIAEGWEWGRPIGRESFERARNGDWDVLLTPTKTVPHEWFGDLRGKRVLGLASGGGQQMPIFAALGAVCTVLDYSKRQLESERAVAAREGYEIEIVRADMSKPLPFADGSFDLIFHPVSNCYVREVRPIWRECLRVLRPGGRLLAGMDNGVNFITDDEERRSSTACPSTRSPIPTRWSSCGAATAACSFPIRLPSRSAASSRRASRCSRSMRTQTAAGVSTSSASRALSPR